MASTSRCTVRATRRPRRSASCGQSARTPSACPRSPRRSRRGTWASMCSGSPASPTRRPASCRSRSITRKSWKSRNRSAARSPRSSRESLAASDKKKWIGERRRSRDRRMYENRRTGADRRLDDRGRSDGDRRAIAERRIGDRRSGGDRRTEAGWQPVVIDDAVLSIADDAALVAAAVDVRDRARARFSNFKVGAALETENGDVVTGCNVENATYGLTMCAERVALYKALSEGHDVFRRIAVVADTNEPTPPCGSCRQLLWEYCGDIEVIIANLSEVKRRMRLSELLPMPFDARLLE